MLNRVNSWNVRAVKATVRPDVLRGGIGWHFDASGLGLGRHIAETYQDPTLVRPGFFFCPTPDGSRQVVYQAGKTIAFCKFTELKSWQHQS